MEHEVKRSGWRMGPRTAAVAACPLFVISTALAQAVPQDDVAAPPVSPPPPPLTGSGGIKSEDQIVCEMTGDCSLADPGMVDGDRPEGRYFRIARPRKSATHKSPPAAVSGARLKIAIPHIRPMAAAEGNPQVRASSKISFAPGSATMTPEGKAEVLRFLGVLKSRQLAGKRFQVSGHTDASGNAAANLKLSQQRAQAVVDLLVANGVSASQLVAKGYGSQRPLPGEAPNSPANRRVEFERID